ncbi:MAG TPA: hypothetical protein PK417_06545 [Hyphomonas sp.]|nr:hypothetical protein [Hyphomonas sp.]HRX73758.1 hypothetical protein [Hyphomonas sp.]
MIYASSQTVYDKAQTEFGDMVRDLVTGTLHWFGRLSDVERLVGLCAFILVLFMLVLVKATTRTHQPGKARSFVGSFVLVVVFSFLAGLLIDSEFDPRHFL